MRGKFKMLCLLEQSSCEQEDYSFQGQIILWGFTLTSKGSDV